MQLMAKMVESKDIYKPERKEQDSSSIDNHKA